MPRLRAQRQTAHQNSGSIVLKFLMSDYQFSQAPSAIFIHLLLTSAAAN